MDKLAKTGRGWRGGLTLLSAFCAVFVAAMPFCAIGTEYFVDVMNRQDDSGDGLSVATAKRTIQAAMELAKDNDIVTVLPGEYREGSGIESGTDPARVVITNRVWLRSRDGNRNTFIIGEKAPSETGRGDGELRCLRVTAASALIEGFTICGGAAAYGGGVCCDNNHTIRILDCVVSNNVGYRGGAVYRGTVVKCRISDNVATDSGAALFQGRAYNSLFCRNSGGKHLFSYSYSLVNCTVTENDTTGVCQNYETAFYNSIVVGNSGVVGPTSASKQPKFYNSVTDVGQAQFAATNDACAFLAPRWQLFAPAFGDWRPLAGAECVGRGLASFANATDSSAKIQLTNANAQWQTYLQETYAGVDYNGNAIPSEGAVDCGCVQGAATPAGGRVGFIGDASTMRFVASGMAASKFFYSHAYPETWPTQYCIKAEYASGMPTFMYQLSPDAAGFNCRFPEMDGWFRFFAPPPETDITVTPTVASYVRYVDKAHGLDTNGGTATNDAFRTIQAAVDAASNFTLIHVAPGFYDEGGAVMNGVSNRVAVNNKKLRILADEGPERTFIVGGDDPESANETGQGPNAVRCVSWYTSSNVGCLQGFTLTGGRTDDGVGAAISDSNYKPYYGGAIHDGAADQVCDCIISNNIAHCGAANINGKLIRCRIYGNRSVFRGPLWGGQFVLCDIAGNVAGDSARPWAVSGTKVVLSTLDGGCGSSSTMIGCIIDNRNVTKEGSYSTDGCVLWGTVPAGQTGVLAARPRFVSETDRHLRPSSPALGAAACSDLATVLSYYSSDLDGNPPYFVDGVPTAGAYQVPDWTYPEMRGYRVILR